MKIRTGKGRQTIKTSLRDLSLLPALVAFLALILPQSMAETFTTLHSFAKTGPYPYTNSDGVFPDAGLILSGNTLYGTANEGGTSGNGTLFAINIDGTGFTNLHTFSGGSDGAGPYAGLVLMDGILYGSAVGGGSSGNGSVFKLHTDGTAFTILHTFAAGSGSGPIITNSDGVGPSGLILSDNVLYGTTYSGGSLGGGTVFAVNTDGTGFTNLHAFATAFAPTNVGGAGPNGGLILSGRTLYGTTRAGGSLLGGTVFAVNTDGTSFTNLHAFDINTEGYYPDVGLTLSGNTLFGTTQSGPDVTGLGGGTVFALHIDGTGFTELHTFAFTSLPYPGTNSDGNYPIAGLLLSGNMLYGTADFGGALGGGTVFAVNTDGTHFTTLYNFTQIHGSAPSDWVNTCGANPSCKLILSGNTLYGAASDGGRWGVGTVFSLALPPPQLAILASQDNLVLAWPTNVTGLTLQSTTNLGSSAVWSTSSSTPTIISGQNVITNPISGAQRFFRLSQ